ncbi:hypothetical protein FSP39_025116 [Pinctada imbricata]|uniref:Sulfotransferase domain-containing protein n=1 Tax=Pinctada imbricata TaxID=66713 RepID=A0AA88XGZ7_PINIB|nr:hypothetical protein FSP39_025116 [Pinctada imbricata]
MWKPYWICRRQRRSATCIVCLAIVYIVFFNTFAFIFLSRSNNSTTSLVSKHGSRYIGIVDIRSLCKTPTLSKIPLPRTALVSFPGSGNTWIRHIVQQATGILTGSVYNDKSLLQNGFPGEGISNGSVILIKTHKWGEMERSRYRRAVLILRNPYDALLAEFNRRHGGHMGYASEMHFRSEWSKYVTIMSDEWVKMNYDWLQFSSSLHVTHYENFRKNPKAEIKSLLKFLNVTIPFKDMLCVMKNVNGYHKRIQTKTTRYEPFPSHIRTKIDADIAFIESELLIANNGRTLTHSLRSQD